MKTVLRNFFTVLLYDNYSNLTMYSMLTTASEPNLQKLHR